MAECAENARLSVTVAADNRGKVVVTEPPTGARILHRPKSDRPATWDFSGDGYPIFQRTGGLPDIVAYHVIVVRDRHKARRAGELVERIAQSKAAKSVVDSAGDALANAAIGRLAASAALGLIMPVAELVGGMIADTKDKVLQSFSGSLVLTNGFREKGEFSEEVMAPDNSMILELDGLLFDAQIDEDSTAEIDEFESILKDRNLLLTGNA